MIPQGFIQDLLARVDIVDVVGRYVQLKKAGQNYLGLCPFHGEKTASFTVSPAKQFFHCFGCGAHGTAIGFLIDQRGLSFTDAVQELAQQVGLRVPESVRRDGAPKTQGLQECLQRACDFYRGRLKESPVAIEYLKSRGLTGTTAARFSLGFAPDAWQPLRDAVDSYDDARLVESGLVIVGDEGKRYDRFRGRVMFPIRNRRGTVLGFGARSIDGAEPKYLNSPETPLFHKGQELYGLFEAHEAIRRRGRVIVCEGYMDVIQLAQAGFEEAVAALGTAITAAHVTALFRQTDHVVFSFDGDAAGRKAARRALEAALPVFGDSKRASFVLLPEGEDPDSLIKAYGAAAFEAELGKAMPLSRWFVACLSEGKALDTAEGRAALVAEAKPLLASMPAGAMRLQLIGELAATSRTATGDIESLFGLRRARRMPEQRGLPERSVVDVGDLKVRILQCLIGFPDLAKEFETRISEETALSEATIDRKLAEVCQVAIETETPSTGSVVQALAESPFAADYQSLATSGLVLDDDPGAARDELSAAFARLQRQRLELRRHELLERYRAQPTAENLRAYQAADQEYVRLRTLGVS